MDLVPDHHGIHTGGEIELCQLRVVGAPGLGDRFFLAATLRLLRQGCHDKATRLLHRLLGLPLHHLRLLLSLPLLGLKLVHSIKDLPALLLTPSVLQLLENENGLLRLHARLTKVPGVEVDIALQCEHVCLVALVACLLEVRKSLVTGSQGILDVTVHQVHLADSVQSRPDKGLVVLLLRCGQCFLRQLHHLVAAILQGLRGGLSIFVFLHQGHDAHRDQRHHHVHLLCTILHLAEERHRLVRAAHAIVKILLRDVDVGLDAKRDGGRLGVARLLREGLRLRGRLQSARPVLAPHLGIGELEQGFRLSLRGRCVLVELAGLRNAPQRTAVLLLVHVHVCAHLQGHGLLFDVIDLLEELECLLRHPQSLLVVLHGSVQAAHRPHLLRLQALLIQPLEGVCGIHARADSPVGITEGAVDLAHLAIGGRLSPHVPRLLEALQSVLHGPESSLRLVLLQARRDDRLEDSRLSDVRLDALLVDVHRLLSQRHGLIKVPIGQVPGSDGMQLGRLEVLAAFLLEESERLLRRANRSFRGP
mmetsp:Transcript_114163/g.233607  ORF Transcript_114163/g.233607 Transcript_114163/m.233607 type:complete len:533 (+) Transcript_114163:402-2000(+)